MHLPLGSALETRSIFTKKYTALSLTIRFFGNVSTDILNSSYYWNVFIQSSPIRPDQFAFTNVQPEICEV